jgi:periplasmic protein TonB
MVATIQSGSPFNVDPRRVAAWSGVLLLHVLVLGMMLLPRDTLKLRSITAVVDPVIEFEPFSPPPLPPPPPIAVPPPPINLVPLAPPPVTLAPEPVIAAAAPPVIDSPGERIVVPPNPGSIPGEPSGVSTGPTLVSLKKAYAPPPPYPRPALIKGIEGTVELRVLVDAKGLPQSVEVIGGSGNRHLENAAVRAVKRWRFHPLLIDGQPSPAWAHVPVVFSIDD